MKAVSLVRKIKSLGGTAELLSQVRQGIDGDYTLYVVKGELNGYDVHMHDLDSSYFTVRHQSKRNYYDPGADYNNGGHSFCHRLIDLDYYANQLAKA